MILKLREKLAGAHVHVDVFVGPDGDHLANAGRLTFRLDEWPYIAAVLTNGAPHVVVRSECPACRHSGHVGEQCLVAVAQGDGDLFCMCGDESHAADRLLADAMTPFDVEVAQALALVDPAATNRTVR